MDPQNPNDYVAALKQKGADDQAVIAILRNAGWPEKEAVTALASYYEAQTSLAIPARPRSVGGPILGSRRQILFTKAGSLDEAGVPSPRHGVLAVTGNQA